MSSIPSSAMPHAQTSDGSSGYSSSEGSNWTPSRSGDHTGRTGRESWMDKARDNKTGIAIGIGIGALAAAAIPFMLSDRSRTEDRTVRTRKSAQ
jgi:hypothetical protein